MSQNAKSFRAALLAIAFFALVVAAAPGVFAPDVQVKGAAETTATGPVSSAPAKPLLPAT